MNEKIETGPHSAAITELARVLYEKMEHLDPGSGAGVHWNELPERDREFYALLVEEVIEHGSLIIRAMADYDVILRHPKLPEKMNHR